VAVAPCEVSCTAPATLVMFSAISADPGGLGGQFLDLVGHHGEALAGLAGACGVDGGVRRVRAPSSA
jgi:hypothetical protein